MAMRRNGRPGDYLITDDWTGCTTYHSKVRKDYWNNLSEIVLQRNLQEIATPLSDPYPVKEYRGPQYEPTNACDFEVQPAFIGKTNVPFPNTNITQLFNLDPGIGEMSVGCTLVIS